MSEPAPRPHRVLVVDADTPTGRAVVERLLALGQTPVLGARDQLRVETLASVGGVLTVPVGDATDADVVLTTLQDGDGAVSAVVLPVDAGVGRPESMVRPVADAMAMVIGLVEAAEAHGVDVWVVGPGASAVVAWAQERVPAASHRISVRTYDALADRPSSARQPTQRSKLRRRDQVAHWLRRVVPKVDR